MDSPELVLDMLAMLATLQVVITGYQHRNQITLRGSEPSPANMGSCAIGNLMSKKNRWLSK